MKYFFLIVMLAAYSQALSRVSLENAVKDIGFFQSFLLDLIGGMAGRGNCLDSLNEEKAVECLTKIKANNSFCHTFVNSFASCTKEFVENVENCAKPKEKDVPTAAIASIVSQIEFLCNTDGEHGFEILNPCIYQRSTQDCLRTFQRNVTKLFDEKDEEKIFPTVCNSITDAKECLTESIKKQCQNEITRNTLTELYNAFIKPCNEVSKTK
ncbi:hypothetical protein HHI36_008633 [Cryptolaemus montrouzieri]|uniref:Uncharacterized protein n=1 Tax=Cryptolaemus montrouzieri TaxID=559131 RepID=A0ABD2MSZ3_9CUCU